MRPAKARCARSGLTAAAVSRPAGPGRGEQSMQADGEVPPVPRLPAAPRTMQITRVCTVSELLGFSYSAIQSGGSRVMVAANGSYAQSQTLGAYAP